MHLCATYALILLCVCCLCARDSTVTTTATLQEGYEVVSRIGHGSFGTVDLATDLKTGEQVVVKQIDVSRMDEGEQATAQREVYVLRQLDHGNIVQYITSFIQSETLHIVMAVGGCTWGRGGP